MTDATRERIAFYERIPIPAEQLEDLDTARLVTRIQSDGQRAFAELYERYFDRVYGYLRVTLKDSHQAEDIAQQVFMKAMEGIGRYETRPGRPFRAWLFTIARNEAISHLRKSVRESAHDPAELNRQLDHAVTMGMGRPESGPAGITDGDLLRFIERLPLAQRQTLFLRYVLDLPSKQIAEILDKTPDGVDHLHHRALVALADRLQAIGRGSAPRRRTGMLTRVRSAPVIVRRRFALGPPSSAAAFTRFGGRH